MMFLNNVIREMDVLMAVVDVLTDFSNIRPLDLSLRLFIEGANDSKFNICQVISYIFRLESLFLVKYLKLIRA